MSKKIKDTDYLFITALLRAREAKLLTHSRMERMIEAKSAEEAAKVLEECGYENASGMGSAALDKIVSAKRAKVMDELATLTPDKSLVDIFRIRYDYHNAKVLIKAEASGKDGAKLLSGAGRIDPEALTDAYRRNELADLPDILAKAVTDAKDTLARTADPQLSDFILDKAYFKEFYDFAHNSGSKFLRGYAKLMIDSANLRTTVRSLRMKKHADFLSVVLIPGGDVALNAILTGIAEGKSLSDIFSSTPLAPAAAAGDNSLAGGALTEFEKKCDNTLIAYLGKAKGVSFGEQVLIAYICSFENECLSVRIIMTGKLSGLSPEVIRERLRDSYV